MNDLSKKKIPIYSSVHDIEEFQLVSLTIVKKKDRTLWIKEKTYSIKEIYKLWRDATEYSCPQNETSFYLSCLILSISERPQRKLLNRIIQPKSRNIELFSQSTEAYLYQVQNYAQGIKEMKTKIGQEEKEEKLIQLNSHIKDAFKEISQKIGLSKNTSTEYSYKITPDVIAAAKEEKCIEYLKGLKGIHRIFPFKFREIRDHLNASYSTDAEAVIPVFEKTETRNHLSAFSLSTSEDNELFVSMANAEKKYVKMESWKFVQLIEDYGSTRRMHEFPKGRYDSPPEQFEFCNQKKGFIFGKFDSEFSCFYLMCCQDYNGSPKKGVDESAIFYVDSTYLLCIYTMLKRLDDDRERFRRLKEEAQTMMPVEDPFESLHIS